MIFEEQLLGVLSENRVNVLLTNPCARLQTILNLLSETDEFDVLEITREEHGVGIAAGAYMAGMKPAMLIQSTGIGNILNTIASLTLTYQFPLLIIASWRGVIDEPIAAQNIFGRAVEKLLTALKIETHIIDENSDISTFKEKILEVYVQRKVLVLLCSPRVWTKSQDMYSEKTFEVSHPKHYQEEVKQKNSNVNPSMTRIDVFKDLTDNMTKKDLIIANIGFPARELYHVNDQSHFFYMTGSFGQVSAIGIGIARYQPNKQIYVLEGDGSMLMSPGILPMIAAYSPNNLTIICLNNGSYGSTGNQPTLYNLGFIDFRIVTHGFGFQPSKIINISDRSDLMKLLPNLSDYQFIQIFIRPLNAEVGKIPLTPKEIGDRFMNSISD
ncbi:sulfopyruvate decarboxylase subunit alpha [Candidatus Heimdallarchaeota archaeon B3_Heim]|nr:MAG: sulfopyruvate decarboxylase subunit alpha [Candidatus Heimdallarchaeota archaeon B3_Heim]